MRKPAGLWSMAAVAVLCAIGLIWLPRLVPPRAKLALPPPPGVALMPDIRVALTQDLVSTISVGVDGPFQVLPPGSQQVLWNAPRQSRTEVTLTSTGFRWAGRSFPVTRLEVAPRGEGAVWVGDKEYRGRVQLIRQTGGRMRVVNVVPLEDYIASVIDSEMPLEFGTEARKAQAIVARSYALAQMQNAGRKALFHLYSTTRSQKYNGRKYQTSAGRLLAGDSADSRRLAYETAGMVCTYQGNLFCTYYSAVCGGQTSRGSDFFSDAAAPHRSVGCEWCSDAPLFDWQATFSTSELQEKLQQYWKAEGTRFGTLQKLAIRAARHVGGIDEVLMTDERVTLSLPATAFRRVIGTSQLYSHHFSIARQGTSWVFTGAGHGHGVGLCQWGARGLGQSGHNFMQILEHYYPGSRVVILTSE